MLKILMSTQIYEASLLNNISNDIPYEINVLTGDVSNYENDTETMTLESESNLNKSIERDNLQSALDGSIRSHELETLSTSNSNSNKRSKKTNYLDKYAILINNLIEMKFEDSDNQSVKSNKDSVNLTLLNRVLLLNDLMSQVKNKTFLKTYSIKLCELVNKIIEQVFFQTRQS